ncbi:2-nitropropane dioxygenase [Helicobacter monodelphidis]|uniref:nitronate monooxygenase n=1 Tax=Helicobacter sp. 15-1451 TaxID=2004995 RepID=UPI000DCE25DC|nr:nitronate monooxygenase [Helicobacter sp. 15-1451]RAX58602.1 2-nitropropane dioxygenase [Helicobacter sp. 15-1451]
MIGRKTTLPALKIRNHLIPYPIVQGGMGIGISWDELAGSVSKEGGLGVISAVGTGYYKHFAFAKKLVSERPLEVENFYSKEALFEIFKNARKLCGNAPLGANILYAINNYGRVVRDACEAGADVIITGAGLPTDMPEFTKDFPEVALVPIVSSARALKIICKRWTGRYNRLPDAVVVEGPLSGGHQGVMYEDCFKEEYQLETLIPEVIKEVKNWGNIPILAAGGIWDRADIDSFLKMGASGVQMGTRFLGSHECDAKYYATLMPSVQKEDIKLIKSPVGYPARAIVTGVLDRLKEGNAPKVACISNCVQPCHRGVEAKAVGYCIADRLGDAAFGDSKNGLYFTGANGYRIEKIVSVREIMDELICD